MLCGKTAEPYNVQAELPLGLKINGTVYKLYI
jgi:hypothetical protein